MRILGLIPARGGSKGVLRKNIRDLCGRPLLDYTARAALAVPRLTQVVLSTDDHDIAERGRYCGVQVPFIRPADLARDETPMLPVVQHALRYLEDRGAHFDAVCLLQPTNPLRRPEDIEGCIDLFENAQADAVVTVLPVPAEYHPHWVYFPDEVGHLRLYLGGKTPIPRRQDLPPAVHREGSVYVTRRDVVMEGNSLYGNRLLGYQLDENQYVNIDVPADWERAQELIAARQ